MIDLLDEQSLLQHLISIRCYLHQHPELSFIEHHTAAYIASYLRDDIGIDNVATIGTTGIVALIKGRDTHHTIALRADIDALPITEENDVPYRSLNNGVMHACGHDVHTACLLGTAQLLWRDRDQLPYNVKLIFQPGEEKSPGGASILIQEGVLKHPTVDRIVALHVHPEMKVGDIGWRAGSYMASADEIHLTIQGKGGHAALPHLTIDPITIAAEIITQLQSLFARKNNAQNPSVLSFGMIQGGSVTNVIPDTVHIKGTFRTFDNQWRSDALQLLNRTVDTICSLHGASYTLEIPAGYPSLYNDPAWTQACINTLANSNHEYTIKELDRRMTAEDFSFYAAQVPAFFFRIGTNNAANEYSHSVHHPRFDIDARAMIVGVNALYDIAMNTSL